MSVPAERVQQLQVQPQRAMALTASDVRANVNLIQQVMDAVMKPDVHYGKIPGTPKPTLYKAGCEVLAATFRIAPSYKIEDLSTADCIRYRVICVGTHQVTGNVLGEGAGECSSNEEKYKWRKAYDKEFDAAPENRRRIKHGKEYSTKQVRAEPADCANTILKMACKRAQVAMTLNVTAASDCFAQDLEDLPEHLRPEADAPTEKKVEAKPAYPQASIDTNKAAWTELIVSGKKSAAQIVASIESKATLTEEQRKAILALTKPEHTNANP